MQGVFLGLPRLLVIGNKDQSYTIITPFCGRYRTSTQLHDTKGNTDCLISVYKLNKNIYTLSVCGTMHGSRYFKITQLSESGTQEIVDKLEYRGRLTKGPQNFNNSWFPMFVTQSGETFGVDNETNMIISRRTKNINMGFHMTMFNNNIVNNVADDRGGARNISGIYFKSEDPYTNYNEKIEGQPLTISYQQNDKSTHLHIHENRGGGHVCTKIVELNKPGGIIRSYYTYYNKHIINRMTATSVSIIDLINGYHKSHDIDLFIIPPYPGIIVHMNHSINISVMNDAELINIGHIEYPKPIWCQAILENPNENEDLSNLSEFLQKIITSFNLPICRIISVYCVLVIDNSLNAVKKFMMDSRYVV